MKWVIHDGTTYLVSGSDEHFNFEKIYVSQYNFLNIAKPVSICLTEGSEIFVNKGKLISSSNI
jgi:hypothetical protein